MRAPSEYWAHNNAQFAEESHQEAMYVADRMDAVDNEASLSTGQYL